MKDRLFEALKIADADYADIRLEINERNAVAYRGKEIDAMSTSKLEGGIVRACYKGGWGIAAFDSLADLAYQVRRACESARWVGSETTRLAQSGAVVDTERTAELKTDFRTVPLDDKIKLVTAYNDIILRHDPAIETTGVSYSDAFRTVYFASTHGHYFMEERPRIILRLSAVARNGSLTQRAMEGISSSMDYAVVEGLEEKAELAAGRAVALLNAPKCTGGKHTVVLDPELAGVFAHEAFGHLSEADFIYENPKMKELMVVGRRMGVDSLNIVDDGSMPGLLGTQAFDDEGTPTGKTYLIRNGILSGHLHSLETAAKMDETPTGNARAIGRGYPPIVRMTNTYIEGGDLSFDAMIADIDDGVYAKSMHGGQTMMEMFTFSAGYGYRIEHGQLGEMIRDVTLTGNVFETLDHIDGFGDDFEMIERGGGCGKGGQSPLPVTFGAPHIRIRDVVIGGQEHA